jgi:hypothetical protein
MTDSAEAAAEAAASKGRNVFRGGGGDGTPDEVEGDEGGGDGGLNLSDAIAAYEAEMEEDPDAEIPLLDGRPWSPTFRDSFKYADDPKAESLGLSANFYHLALWWRPLLIALYSLILLCVGLYSSVSASCGRNYQIVSSLCTFALSFVCMVSESQEANSSIFLQVCLSRSISISISISVCPQLFALN